MAKRLGDIKLNQTVLFVCDIQERFRKAISCFEEISHISNRLTDVSRILDIPLIVTEQTHVCIQQTVIDLLNRDIEVHVVADAVSSRNQVDRIFALELLPDIENLRIPRLTFFPLA
ncbi:isochorismatase domain-containing protein 1 [Elysia marginata]|uniref:Isochorismatase domain-containing protein 1 n=1 Tax=Elysia marginata TaxID=1093978 RepID=A0AAV4IMJ6_9GAST|nr:isochorismatase domain-containing protein 1 [Elysia marginata]